MLRLFGILVTVLTAIVLAVVTFPGFFKLNREFPLAQAISFRPALTVLLGVLLLLALLLALVPPIRAFALSVAAVFFFATVANGVILAQRGFGAGGLPEATEHSVRVLTWNTAGPATDPGVVAQTAVTSGADIVALPETTIETGEQIAIAMRELDRPMWAHHVEYGEGWDAQSTTLLISPDLGDYSVIESSRDATSNTAVLPSLVAMPVDGDGPIVVVAHAVAPRPSYMEPWSADLQWLADQCVAGGNVIMAGDFNATVDHMDRLGVDDGVLGACRDAAADSGTGAVGTWPTGIPALLGAPIDHVLYSDAWTVSGTEVLTNLDDIGSDHRPLLAQLEPAA